MYNIILIKSYMIEHYKIYKKTYIKTKLYILFLSFNSKPLIFVRLNFLIFLISLHIRLLIYFVYS